MGKSGHSARKRQIINATHRGGYDVTKIPIISTRGSAIRQCRGILPPDSGLQDIGEEGVLEINRLHKARTRKGFVDSTKQTRSRWACRRQYQNKQSYWLEPKVIIVYNFNSNLDQRTHCVHGVAKGDFEG